MDNNRSNIDQEKYCEWIIEDNDLHVVEKRILSRLTPFIERTSETRRRVGLEEDRSSWKRSSMEE